MDIHYNGIRIRNAEAGDCALLAEWWNDGSVMAHAGFPNGLGITADEIAASISTDTDETRRRLIIEYRGLPIGEMSFRIRTDLSAEIGIKICRPEYRERGLGRVILSLLIKELFGRGYRKIVLDTNKTNERAQHVYELLGFKKLRVNENSWRDQIGNLQSSVDYELTEDRFHDHTLP
ncbi:MAG: GNAT family N-acetyltransferase [Clostridia bacterium]|nr:GNAT family N-acetyltransferase [Clostridia bacterium]